MPYKRQERLQIENGVQDLKGKFIREITYRAVRQMWWCLPVIPVIQEAEEGQLQL
jgi:hypothetical protein